MLGSDRNVLDTAETNAKILFLLQDTNNHPSHFADHSRRTCFKRWLYRTKWWGIFHAWVRASLRLFQFRSDRRIW